MTIILELSPETASRLEADAKKQNRPVVDVARQALDDRYDGDTAGDYLYPEDEDMANLPPLPAILTEPLAVALCAAREDIEAGRIVPGHVALAELRHLVGRE